MEEDKNVISGSELKDELPDCSLGDFLLPKMKSTKRDEIIQIESESGASLTTQEILKQSLGIAEGLLSIGFHVNDVVAFVSRNRNELYTAALGVIWAGGVLAPLHHEMTVYELKHAFGLAQPKYIFSESEPVKNVGKALSLLGMDAKIILLDSKACEEMYHITFTKLIREVDVETYKPQPIKSPSTQLSMMLPTSGTTGFSKEVGVTHRNVIYQISVFVNNSRYQGANQITTPLSWITNILQYLSSVALGTKRIFMKNRTDENILKAIHNFKPLWGIYSPSTLTSLMNHPDFRKYDVSSVRIMLSGGSPVTEYLVNRVKKEWNKDVTVEHMYGLTESFGPLTVSDGESRIPSVGKLRSGVKLKVVDRETNKSLGANKVGELCAKSIGMMKCYVRNPEATNEVIDQEGWLHTGDLGYYDDNEFVYIVDRIKDMIPFQDWRIIPAELESLIETLPGVLEAGVAGIPNEEDENHVMALVVKRDGYNINESDIIRLVEETLSDQNRLRGGVKFVQSIPRTPVGKIKRRQLKELAQSLYYGN